MDSCEDGPGRKAGLPTWGRVGQVRLGLWKGKKKDYGGGIRKQREKQQEHYDGSSERGKLLGIQRSVQRGKQLKSNKSDHQRGLSPCDQVMMKWGQPQDARLVLQHSSLRMALKPFLSPRRYPCWEM